MVAGNCIRKVGIRKQIVLCTAHALWDMRRICAARHVWFVTRRRALLQSLKVLQQLLYACLNSTELLEMEKICAEMHTNSLLRIHADR